MIIIIIRDGFSEFKGLYNQQQQINGGGNGNDPSLNPPARIIQSIPTPAKEADI